MRQFGRSSLRALERVHPQLVHILTRALHEGPWDFKVTEGLRSIDRQRELKAAGKSWTMRSKHLLQSDGYSHAADIMALPYDGAKRGVWERSYYSEIAACVLAIATEESVRVTWGGGWEQRTGHYDGPHFQIDL